FCALGQGEVGFVLGQIGPVDSSPRCRDQRPSQKKGPEAVHNRQPARRLDAPFAFTISCCHHVHAAYTRPVRLNWNSLQLAIISVSALLLGTGCSGISASGGVSPATFFLPGLGLSRPDI